MALSIDGKYGYLINGGPNTVNLLSAYKRDRDTGALTQVGSTFQLGSQCQGLLAMHPTGRWLLVYDFPNISVYPINADGSLSAAPVSQASAPHISSLQLPSYGSFVYTLRYRSNPNGASPSWIDCYSFDAGVGTLTALPALTVSGPAGASGLKVPDGGAFAIVTASDNPPATQVGAVYLYPLDSNTGAVGSCLDSISSHTKRPLSIHSQGAFFYVLENEVTSFNNVPTQFCISAYRIVPGTGKISELGDSPYQAALPPSFGAINSKRLYVVGATGFYSEAPCAAFHYKIDPTTGQLTAPGTEIPLSPSPQLIAVDASEHSLYLSTSHPRGQGFESSLDIYNTSFPSLTCDVTPGLQNTTFACKVNAPPVVVIATAGFYYGTDPSPDSNDSTLTGVVNGNTFSATFATSLFTPGTRYYARAFATTPAGETFLGDVQPFAITYPLISGFSRSPIGIGARLTISGQFFSGTPADNTVVFSGGATAVPFSASPTSLSVTVPPGAASGSVYVTASGLQGYPSSQTLQIQPTPSITGFLPLIAGVGAPISLKGSGFKNPIVSFRGGVSGALQSVAPDGTSLVVTVPQGAQSGPLTVSCNGVVSALSASSFTLQSKPAITGLSTLIAATGTTLTLSGSPFSPTGVNQVLFPSASGTVAVTASHVTPASLEVVVPSKAISGAVSVVCNGVPSEPSLSKLTILQVAGAGTPESYYTAACNSVGLIVSIRNVGDVYVSADSGMTWSGAFSLPRQFPALSGLRLTDVFHYAGQFYIAGYTSRATSNGGAINSGYLFSSINGTGWMMTPDMPALLSAVCSSGTALLGVRNYSPTAHAPGTEFLPYFGADALQLSPRPRVQNLTIVRSCFGSTGFVLLPNSNQLVTYDQNGSNPQIVSTPAGGGSFPAKGLSDACWVPFIKQFVAVGSSSWSSPDSSSWTPFLALPSFSNPGDVPSRIASSSQYLILGTLTGCVYASPDSVRWFPVIQNAPGAGVQIVDILPCGPAFLVFNNQSEVFLLTPA